MMIFVMVAIHYVVLHYLLLNAPVLSFLIAYFRFEGFILLFDFV